MVVFGLKGLEGWLVGELLILVLYFAQNSFGGNIAILVGFWIWVRVVMVYT